MEHFDFEELAFELENVEKLLITFSEAAANSGHCFIYHSVINAALEKIQRLKDNVLNECNKERDEWQERLCEIYGRLNVMGQAEVLVYADQIEKKSLEQGT